MYHNNVRHCRSRKLAEIEIAARMKGHQSAVDVPGEIEGATELFYSCLERIGTLVKREDQEKFYGIAVELLPLGSFNAEACFPPQEPPFVLLDTGVLDFAGNLSSVFMGLSWASRNQDNFKLSEQSVIDYIWSAGLIYHGGRGEWDKGYSSYVPTLNFSKIPVAIQPQAFILAHAQPLFLICHEIGHIMLAESPTLSDVLRIPIAPNWERQLSEAIVDDFAFNLMINYAIRFPEKDKVRYLISGVDFALSCMFLMQSAFPVSTARVDGKNVVFDSEWSNHPLAIARRERYRHVIEEQGLNEFLQTGYELDRLMYPYAEMIRGGREPSLGFRLAYRNSKLAP
jgi:hypothetical protein